MLLNSLIDSSKCFENSQDIKKAVIREFRLFIFFLLNIYIIYFSFLLIAQNRTSSMMLTRNGESGYPLFVWDIMFQYFITKYDAAFVFSEEEV